MAMEDLIECVTGSIQILKDSYEVNPDPMVYVVIQALRRAVDEAELLTEREDA